MKTITLILSLGFFLNCAENFFQQGAEEAGFLAPILGAVSFSEDTVVGEPTLQVRLQDTSKAKGVRRAGNSGERPEKVLVTIQSVSIGRADGSWLSLNTVPRQYDLFQLAENLVGVLIGRRSLPAGSYHQIRLQLSEDNQVVVGGVEYPLKTPSGQQSGLKLNGEFTLHGGRLTEIVVDFDAEKSILHNRGQGYLLKPVLRIASVEEIRYFRSCKEILDTGYSTGNGVYTIDADGDGSFSPFSVYCDMTTDGGGWTVFQRRQDGSVAFYRYWANYRDGFGSIAGEHWLGNEKIHLLTSGQNTSLRVDMRHGNGTRRYARYNSFRIDSEALNFRLAVSGYSGNAGNSLSYHNGRPFSTRDRDNDQWYNRCARSFKGAWWYRTCHYSNLNGVYYGGRHSSYADGVNWYHWTGYYYSLPFVEMKLR